MGVDQKGKWKNVKDKYDHSTKDQQLKFTEFYAKHRALQLLLSMFSAALWNYE